jgi:hypothetical protein
MWVLPDLPMAQVAHHWRLADALNPCPVCDLSSDLGQPVGGVEPPKLVMQGVVQPAGMGWNRRKAIVIR